MSGFEGRSLSRLWRPRGLLEHVVKMDAEQVSATFERTYFLVIRLDEFSSALGAGLNAAEQSQAYARMADAFYSSSPDAVTTRARPKTDSEHDGSVDSLLDFVRTECHVVRIRKRTWGTSSPAVTVGRAPEHDIPLQHSSVSKLHATLEPDANDLYVADAGSLNRTFVNGEAITDRILLRAGDTIKFGAVRCVVCSPQGLWRALQSQLACES